MIYCRFTVDTINHRRQSMLNFTIGGIYTGAATNNITDQEPVQAMLPM